MEVATYQQYRNHSYPQEHHPHFAPYYPGRSQPSYYMAPQQVPDMSRRQYYPTEAARYMTTHIPHEPSKPSLPSISNLLEIAHAEPTSKYSTSASSPPLRADSVVEAPHSPPVLQQHAPAPGSAYFFESSINNLEPYQQRTSAPAKRHSMPVSGTAPLHNISSYDTSPSNLSTTSYYSAPTVLSPPNSTSLGLAQQQPLPSTFAPTLPTTPLPANPWQHHHYITPSSSFQQSQDRYLCQTCNKAFSRPSSLKIHSHSHTGEKPFRCSRRGCTKAFSVRSNMKRHEKGCHAELMGGL